MSESGTAPRPHARTAPRTHAGAPPSILRAYRSLRGILQADLARSAGVTQASLSLYEQGRAKPRPEIQRRLAKALDVSVAEIFPTAEDGQIKDLTAAAPAPPAAAPAPEDPDAGRS